MLRRPSILPYNSLREHCDDSDKSKSQVHVPVADFSSSSGIPKKPPHFIISLM